MRPNTRIIIFQKLAVCCALRSTSQTRKKVKFLGFTMYFETYVYTAYKGITSVVHLLVMQILLGNHEGTAGLAPLSEKGN
jgi:hypothetical protein